MGTMGTMPEVTRGGERDVLLKKSTLDSRSY